jgi:hypothetical protein
VDEFVPDGRGGLSSPFDMAFGPDDNLYVSSAGTDSVLRYNGKTGAFIDAFIPTGSGDLSFPGGLAFGPDGNLYVASVNPPGKLLRYDGHTGSFIDVFVPGGSGGLGSPAYLAFSPPATALTCLGTTRAWLGLMNSDDAGTSFDLRVEVFAGEAQIGSGELRAAPGGSSGFNNATIDTIPISGLDTGDLPDNADLKIRISARKACDAPGHASGTARLWYGGTASVKNPASKTNAADSGFALTIGAVRRQFYLLGKFELGTNPGSEKAKTIDLPLDSRSACPLRPFVPFGTWRTATP